MTSTKNTVEQNEFASIRHIIFISPVFLPGSNIMLFSLALYSICLLHSNYCQPYVTSKMCRNTLQNVKCQRSINFAQRFAYYSSIILNSFCYLLFSKLCQHNLSRPSRDSIVQLPYNIALQRARDDHTVQLITLGKYIQKRENANEENYHCRGHSTT